MFLKKYQHLGTDSHLLFTEFFLRVYINKTKSEIISPIRRQMLGVVGTGDFSLKTRVFVSPRKIAK